MPDDTILSPIVQFGFAGMSGVLIGVVVWLVSKLLDVLRQTNAVVSANTEAIKELTMRMVDQSDQVRELHNKLLSRPCIAREE